MNIDFFQNLKDKTVVVGGDHHARQTVEVITSHLATLGMKFEVVPYDEDTKDYITQSLEVAQKVSKAPDKFCGVVGCKNGFGVTTVCNKYKNVFATRCDTPEQALDARRVNYCNVLTFGAVFVDKEEIKRIVDNWLTTDFELNDKNAQRLQRLFALQAEC